MKKILPLALLLLLIACSTPPPPTPPAPTTPIADIPDHSHAQLPTFTLTQLTPTNLTATLTSASLIYHIESITLTQGQRIIYTHAINEPILVPYSVQNFHISLAETTNLYPTQIEAVLSLAPSQPVTPHQAPPVEITHTIRFDIPTTPALSQWYYLTMEIPPHTVSPWGLKLYMHNPGSEAFGYGFEYIIEEYVNGIWLRPAVTGGYGWRQIMLLLDPYTTRSAHVNWYHIHGHLPPGQYRLRRRFTRTDVFNEAPPFEQLWPYQYLYTTFTIDPAVAYWQGLTMDILQATPTGLRLEISNTYHRAFSHGQNFWLETYINNQWVYLPGNPISIHMRGYIVDAHSSRQEEIDLYPRFGHLPPGQYRLVRNFTGYGSTQNVNMYATFTIS